MGYFREHRTCSSCNKYRTRDRTSLIRHQEKCCKRKLLTVALTQPKAISRKKVSKELSNGKSYLRVNDKPAEHMNQVSPPVHCQGALTPITPRSVYKKPELDWSSPQPSKEREVALLTPLGSSNVTPYMKESQRSHRVFRGNSDNSFYMSEISSLCSRVADLEKMFAQYRSMNSRLEVLEKCYSAMEMWLSHKAT